MSAFCFYTAWTHSGRSVASGLSGIPEVIDQVPKLGPLLVLIKRDCDWVSSIICDAMIELLKELVAICDVKNKFS